MAPEVIACDENPDATYDFKVFTGACLQLLSAMGSLSGPGRTGTQVQWNSGADPRWVSRQAEALTGLVFELRRSRRKLEPELKLVVGQRG